MKLSRRSLLKLLTGVLAVPGIYYLSRLFFVATDEAIPSSTSFRDATIRVRAENTENAIKPAKTVINSRPLPQEIGVVKASATNIAVPANI